MDSEQLVLNQTVVLEESHLLRLNIIRNFKVLLSNKLTEGNMKNKIISFLLLPLFLVGCNLNLSEKNYNDTDVDKTSIYHSLAQCMWDTLDKINYFEDYSSDSDVSEYALKDVNSDGIKDMVWQLQSYKFNCICIYLLSDEEVTNSSYFNAGGTIEEDTIFLHENDIWEFVCDSSSLWNKAKYHEYIDMKDFSQKLNVFISENYETNEKNIISFEMTNKKIYPNKSTPIIFLKSLKMKVFH